MEDELAIFGPRHHGEGVEQPIELKIQHDQTLESKIPPENETSHVFVVKLLVVLAEISDNG